MRYQGIIFDLDGVLCSTDDFHYQAWKKMADRMQLSFDRRMNEDLRGVSRMESLNIILKYNHRILTEDEKHSLTEYKNREYVKLLGSISKEDLSKEVEDTLEALRKRKYLLAVGSSSKNAEFILNRLGLENYFDAVSDGNHIVRSKPDPEVFLTAARLLRLEPEECLVVEDAQAGIEAAVRGGFDSAGLKEAARCPLTTYPLPGFSALIEVLARA